MPTEIAHHRGASFVFLNLGVALGAKPHLRPYASRMQQLFIIVIVMCHAGFADALHQLLEVRRLHKRLAHLFGLQCARTAGALHEQPPRLNLTRAVLKEARCADLSWMAW